MKPFRFAVQASNTLSAKEWKNLARKVESLGYSTLFIPDHFGDQLSPLVGLTVAAESTSKLKVGSLVFDNDYRHPLVLAREIATLDNLCDGRVEFGIGAGWMTSDYSESGIPLESPKIRVDKLSEAVDIFLELFETGKSSFKGKYYNLTDAQCFPVVSTKPHPKLLIGGGSPKVLQLAATKADIVGINASLKAGAIGAEMMNEISPEKFDQRYRWVKDFAKDRINEIEIQCLTFFVQITESGKEARENLAKMFSIDSEMAGEIPLALVGSKNEIKEMLQKRRERWGFSYVVVHEPEMEQFAEIVAELL
jgi:probable F420-dependent oxidoreductase